MTPYHPTDPVNAKPTTLAELPPQEHFDASHEAAVRDFHTVLNEGGKPSVAAPEIDYDALAKAHGAVDPANKGVIDYDALAKQHGAVQPEPKGALENVGDTLKQYWDKINPVTQAKDLTDTVLHPLDAIKHYGESNAKLAESAKESFHKGEYGQAVRHTLSYFLNGIPGLGSALDEAGNKAKSGDYNGAIADTAALATNIAAAHAAPKIASAAADVAEKAGPATARGLMKSALKPGVADAPTLADVRNVVNTSLEHGIPATEAGSGKLRGLIADYGKQTKAVIDARTAQGATVDPNAVASRLDQINTAQVLPEKDISTIGKAKEAFLARKGAKPAQPPVPSGLLDASGNPVMAPGTPATPAQPVPLDVAQAEKQGTYQQNAAKYGEMSQAQIEAEKALARGYKEEIESQAPELKLLNDKSGAALNLQPVLERAIRRAGNQDLVGVKDIAEIGAGGAIAGPAGAAAGFTTRLLDYPGLKSKLAISINKASWKARKPLSMAASTAKATAILARLAASSEQPAAADEGQK